MLDTNIAFHFQLEKTGKAWRIDVITPYLKAYNDAYRSYNETVGRQKEADKARTELYISIVSLLPGSLLMATAASTSFRTVANRAIVKVLAAANLRRAFTLYRA